MPTPGAFKVMAAEAGATHMSLPRTLPAAAHRPVPRRWEASLRRWWRLHQTPARSGAARKHPTQRPKGRRASVSAAANWNDAQPIGALARHRAWHEYARPDVACSPLATKGWQLPTPHWRTPPAAGRHTPPGRRAASRTTLSAWQLPGQLLAAADMACSPCAVFAALGLLFATSSCSLCSIRHGGPSGGPNASVCQPPSTRNPPLSDVGTK